MPKFIPHALDGVIEVVPDRFGDDRGFFSEVWNERAWSEAGIAVPFVQDNHSVSEKVGTLRGLHFQTPPAGQAKLVRVIKGAVFDVAVDIRKKSPTFGKWVGIEVSAAKWNQLFIPEGFAHGFVTLEPDTHFLYKVSGFYSKDNDRSIRFDDPAIGIEWPIDVSNAILSAKDQAAPLLADLDTEF
ncbi:dTDP-4-dehydrorhamnose 3,5-epimerase [Salmonella enterica subsp. enterica]|nr:dTDP-4-dehydrorhamnose 3,5-epimerase [Salmonella enterica subsp. enterica serovar Enteritidis]